MNNFCLGHFCLILLVESQSNKYGGVLRRVLCIKSGLYSLIALFADYGITAEEIKKDLWVLRYNSDTIKHRLDIAKQINIDKIKTWMVRCKPEIFDVYASSSTSITTLY